MKLWILRHGQAHPMASTDAERALTDVGRAEAREMAGLIAADPPELILVSPYRRARQTAEVVGKALGGKVAMLTADWLTPDDDPLQVLSHLADRHEGSLLLVSHQPLVGQLVSLLVEGHRRGHYPMPTAGLARLDMDCVAAGVARLERLESPAR